ncbi:MAG: type II secretion system F family protein [Oceanococcaceae bacterium]
MIGLMAAAAVVMLIVAVVLIALLMGRQVEVENLQQRFRSAQGGQVQRAGQGALLGRIAQHGRQIDALFDEKGESERLLQQAGLRTPAERMPYFAIQVVLPMVALVLAVTQYLLGGLGAEGESSKALIYGVLLVVVSLLAPRWWLRSKAKTRQAQLRAEVPMLIHILALLFDAGLSLRQALATLTHEGDLVLPQSARELGVILRQLETGAEVSDVVRATSQALEVTELSSVLAVLQQVDRYGGELRAPLMDALELVEKRRELTLREKVSAMAGKMTVVMVLFFFPALLIFVAGPAFMAIMSALGGA